MGEVFQGWRRKLGLTTLIISCALSIVWVKGTIAADYFDFHDYVRYAYGSRIVDGMEINPYAMLFIKQTPFAEQRLMTDNDGITKIVTVMCARRDSVFSIYHLLSTLPLALISAYLLLQRTHKASSERH